jgi:hypothetical protein
VDGQDPADSRPGPSCREYGGPMTGIMLAPSWLLRDELGHAKNFGQDGDTGAYVPRSGSARGSSGGAALRAGDRDCLSFGVSGRTSPCWCGDMHSRPLARFP